MKQFNCLVSLGANMGNINPHHEIPKKGISRAEVILLRVIHGKEQVFNIVPLPGEYQITRMSDDGKEIKVDASDMDVYQYVALNYPGREKMIEETFGIKLVDVAEGLDDLEDDLDGERLTPRAANAVDDDPGLQPPVAAPVTSRVPIS